MTRHFNKTVDVVEKDDDEQVAVSAVLVPNEVDHQLDFLRPEGIERLFNPDPDIGIMHSVFDNSAASSEHRILEQSETIGGREYPAGTWVEERQYEDDRLWQLVKSGLLGGRSIGGTVTETREYAPGEVPDDVDFGEGVPTDQGAVEIVDGAVEEVSDVDVPAVPGADMAVVKSDLAKNIMNEVGSQDEFVALMSQRNPGASESAIRDLWEYMQSVGKGDRLGKSFEGDVFRIVDAGDSEMEFQSDVLGIGIDFPNAGVYVDWNIDAWPEGQQLSDAHVSDYATMEDLEQVTHGSIEPLTSVDAAKGTTRWVPVASTKKELDPEVRDCKDSVLEKTLSEARYPEYEDDFAAGDDWNRPPLEDYIEAYYERNDEERPDDEEVPSEWGDLPVGMREWIARHSLIGDPDADTYDDGLAYPVVYPDGALSEDALENARHLAGQADDAAESIREMAEDLLEEEFDHDFDDEDTDAMTDSSDTDDEPTEKNLEDVDDATLGARIKSALGFGSGADDGEAPEDSDVRDEPTEKAGRTLSKRNVALAKEIHDDAEMLLQSEGVEPHSRSARTYHEDKYDDYERGDHGAYDDDDRDKAADDVAKDLTVDEAQSVVAGVILGGGTRDAILDGLAAEDGIEGIDENRDVASGVVDSVLENRVDNVDENLADEGGEDGGDDHDAADTEDDGQESSKANEPEESGVDLFDDLDPERVDEVASKVDNTISN